MNMAHPDAHPISVAFKAASAANVVVVAAGGNSGAVGEASLGGPHQMIDEVITVSASQTGRSFTDELEFLHPEIPDGISVHPALYLEYGTAVWDEIQAEIWTSDLCPNTDNSLAKDTVAYIDIDASCEEAFFDDSGLAFQPGPFLQQVAVAKAAGVKAIILHAQPDQELAFLQAYLRYIFLTILFGETLPEEIQNLPPMAGIFGERVSQLNDWAENKDNVEAKLSITPNASVDSDAIDRAGGFTSQGPAPRGLKLKPDISAPGVNVLSALIEGYGTLSGTSMASPVVAGAAALVRSAWPDWSPAEIKSALMITSDPTIKPSEGEGLSHSTIQGAGRLRVDRAIDPVCWQIHLRSISVSSWKGLAARKPS